MGLVVFPGQAGRYVSGAQVGTAQEPGGGPE
jgi:hypothetical protein